MGVLHTHIHTTFDIQNYFVKLGRLSGPG